MKALKTGYVFSLISLITLTIVIGIAAFYPAPKRYDYPQYPRSRATDFNSSEYKAQQDKYDQDLKDYQEQNKNIEAQRKIWGQTTLIISLLSGVFFLTLGVIISGFASMLGVGLIFSAFVLMIFGPGLASYYADSSTIPLFGSEPKVELQTYKMVQFGISLVGAILAGGLGFTGFINSKQNSSQT